MGRLLHVGKRTRAGNGNCDEYWEMRSGQLSCSRTCPLAHGWKACEMRRRSSPRGRALHSHDEEWTMGTQAQWEELGDLSFSLGSATTKFGNLFSPQSPQLGHMMTSVGPRTFVFCRPFPP